MNYLWKNKSTLYSIFYPIIGGSITYLLLLMAFNRVNELSESIFKAEWIICIFFAYLWNTSVVLLSKYIGKEIRILSNISEQIFYHVLGVILGSSLVLAIIISAYFYYLIDYSNFSSFSTEMYVFQGLFLFQTILYECTWWGNRLIELRNEEFSKQEIQRTEFISKEMRLFAEDANLPLLYETLETIIGLAYKDPDEAELYAERLAKVYRNTIQSRKEEFISLKEAFSITEEVGKLLQQSRSGGMKTSFSLNDKEAELLFPPIILPRLLVSIATDYIATPIQPLELNFYVENDALVVVAHSCNEKIENPDSLTEVIKSLEETLRIYTKTPIQRIKKGNQYLIKLPAFEADHESWKSDPNASVQPGDQSLFKSI
ncbi:histidine kinase [Flammeovirga sp. SubArs3]|uniref:histidine kinase n=1 Tax=Flammeovirga sp. SubArs3 TaxID=2995316 RepID=UPI00248ABCC0|nr:histidine kinase [Flammeovirga sp. SubArs3]